MSDQIQPRAEVTADGLTQIPPDMAAVERGNREALLSHLVGRSARVWVQNPNFPDAPGWRGTLYGLADHPSLIVEDERLGKRVTLPQSFMVTELPPKPSYDPDAPAPLADLSDEEAASFADAVGSSASGTVSVSREDLRLAMGADPTFAGWGNSPALREAVARLSAAAGMGESS